MSAPRVDADNLRAQFPEVFQPLFEPRRYKVMYGGRGGAKSWSIARALLIQCTQDPLRVLCCREVMRTIADSVHRLLVDQIEALGLQDWYTITDHSIAGLNGSEFLFTGLRAIDAAKIKSYEGVDVAWWEEAQTASERSLDTLIPTIRADGSELWFSLNPELDTDPAYQRLIVLPPENAWVQRVTWRDNPWFPAVLEAERVALQKRDPIAYENIWEGKPRTVVEGAIYAREVTDLIESRRFRPVPYDPKLPVHTVWDLGWNDQTSIVFVQKIISEVRLIDYEEESFLRFDEWAKRLSAKDYLYGDHYLPHDGKNKTQAANGVSAQALLTPLLRQKPKIIARPESKEVPVRAARMMFPRVYMDEKCGRLLDCLKRYRRSVPESTGEPGAPVHDEYSHGADAFGGLAMIVDKISNVADRSPKPTMQPWGESVKGMGM